MGTVRILLVPGADDTKSILPPDQTPGAGGGRGIQIEFQDGDCDLYPRGEQVAVETLALGDRKGVLGLDLLSAIKRGAVIQPWGILSFSVLDARTQKVVGTLRYKFNDKSTIGWDRGKGKPVWKGSEVRGP